MSTSLRRPLGVAAVLALVLIGAVPAPAASAVDCFGKTPTHVMTSPGTYEGTSGSDVVIGSSGNDVIFGLDGADYLCGGDGNDDLWGGGGINAFLPGAGNDRTFGNSNLLLDTVWYTQASGPITANLNLGVVTGEGTDDLSFTRYLHASPYADDLTARNGTSGIYGAGGNDTLRMGTTTGAFAQGEEGDDTLLGGPASDQMNGGPGRDTLTGAGGVDQLTGGDDDDLVEGGTEGDSIHGGPGDDVLRGQDGEDFLGGEEGADDLDGGPGSDGLNGAGETECGGMTGCQPIDTSAADLIRYDAAPAGVSVDLSQGSATGHGSDEMSNVERVLGSPFDDNLTGSSQGEVLDGAGGNDSILAGGGFDTLVGGTGDDTLVGGTDTDTVSYASASRAVVVDLSTSNATGQGTDVVAQVENVRGGPYADRLSGDGGANTLLGSGGADALTGRGGADRLEGGNAADVLTGGAGSDALLGGGGADTARFVDSTAAVVADLGAGSATGQGTDTLDDVENLTGSARGDTLRGDGGANTLSGGAGGDRLVGRAGPDRCLGGTGSDSASTCEVRSSIP